MITVLPLNKDKMLPTVQNDFILALKTDIWISSYSYQSVILEIAIEC
jgi:hypothetical protein